MSISLGQYLYRSWRVAGRRLVSSGNYVHPQRADWVFLRLESVETREAPRAPCFVTICCSGCDHSAMEATHARMSRVIEGLRVTHAGPS